MAEIMAEFGGMSQFVQPGDRVLVKPNILAGVDKGKHVTTHPPVVLWIPFQMLEMLIFASYNLTLSS